MVKEVQMIQAGAEWLFQRNKRKMLREREVRNTQSEKRYQRVEGNRRRTSIRAC